MSVFLCFRQSLRLFIVTPGQPNANRGFSVFSKKLIFVELGLKFQEPVPEFEDSGLKFEDSGLEFEDLGLKLEDLGWKLKDLGRKFEDLA